MKEDIYFYIGKYCGYLLLSFLFVHFILKKLISKKTKVDKNEEIILVIGISCLLYFISR